MGIVFYYDYDMYAEERNGTNKYIHRIMAKCAGCKLSGWGGHSGRSFKRFLTVSLGKRSKRTSYEKIKEWGKGYFLFLGC